MVERRTGRILNISSAAGEIQNPTFGVYAATKGYVSTFSEILARQLEPLGITVTVLVPDWTGPYLAQDALEAFDIEPETREIMSPTQVARAGYEGLLDGPNHVIPGRPNWEAVKNALEVRASAIKP